MSGSSFPASQPILVSPDEPRLAVGVMSGTSADGIDVAICRLLHSASPVWGELQFFHSAPYSPDLRAHIHELRRLGACTLQELTDLTRRLTLEHADAIRTALGAARTEPPVLSADVGFVADHGQTVFHAPPLTLQLLDPALLAFELGIAVVSDFRRADLAAGGQGAPLVPYTDRRLFSHPTRARALLNLGGIANVTLLPPGDSPTPAPLAFDTGPANCLSDHLCRTLAPDTGGVDTGGRLALQGTPHEKVIAAFLASDYFRLTPPKATDGPAMIAAFERAGGTSLKLPDALATAAECVARSVADAVLRLTPCPDDLVLSGGGVFNSAVTRALARLLPDLTHLTTDQLGIPSQAKEAIAFALLGNALLDGVPGNLPTCTGASRPVLCGSVTPRP